MHGDTVLQSVHDVDVYIHALFQLHCIVTEIVTSLKYIRLYSYFYLGFSTRR